MRTALPIASLFVGCLLSACGDGEGRSAPRSSASSSTAGGDTADPSASATPTEPSYELLSKAGLRKALLKLDDLPPGYSQDPQSQDNGNKTFCDYKPPAVEKVRVRRDFVKGAGMSAELVSVILRQFGSPDEAKAAWQALTTALRTCKSEVYDGSKLTYSKLSAPKLGDASLGLKIEVDDYALLQNFVLSGPVMVSAGGGGLMNADADVVAQVLEAQVKRYVAKATE